MDYDEAPCIVIDNGSGVIKMGYAGDDEPVARVPVMLGQPRLIETDRCTRFAGHMFVGGTAQRHRKSIAINHPLDHGIVTDWEDMTDVWRYVFDHESSGRTVLLTEAPLTPRSQRLKTAEIMFETFRVAAMHIASTGQLCVISTGLTTGLALDIGDGVTSAVPVFKGNEVASCVQRNDMAGRDLNKYLMRLLEANLTNCWPGFEGSHRFSNTASIRLNVRDAKEKFCYVAADLKTEMAKKPEKNVFGLPDGKVIIVGNEAFRCPEALFQPALLGLSAGGIHEMICSAIEGCDEDLRETLYGNIVLCGGSAQLPGLVPRLKKELAALAPANMDVNIEGPQDTFCAWKGGSVLASMPTFKTKLTTIQDYHESGREIFL